MDPFLTSLLGDLLLAGVFAGALKVVWGKYQEQLRLNAELMERQKQDYRRLAGLEDSRDPEA